MQFNKMFLNKLIIIINKMTVKVVLIKKISLFSEVMGDKYFAVNCNSYLKSCNIRLN